MISSAVNTVESLFILLICMNVFALLNCFSLSICCLVPEMAFSSPPTLSLSLPLPRGGGQGDRAPVPQAVVKPQVLTHLIEGFVIQEGAEPFPVSVSAKYKSSFSWKGFFFQTTKERKSSVKTLNN